MDLDKLQGRWRLFYGSTFSSAAGTVEAGPIHAAADVVPSHTMLPPSPSSSCQPRSPISFMSMPPPSPSPCLQQPQHGLKFGVAAVVEGEGRGGCVRLHHLLQLCLTIGFRFLSGPDRKVVVDATGSSPMSPLSLEKIGVTLDSRGSNEHGDFATNQQGTGDVAANQQDHGDVPST